MTLYRERAILDVLSGPPRNRRLMIFTFHRVLPEPDELLPDEPTAENFAQILEWIGLYLRVLPLPEAARRLREGRLPSRSACITFDDGYLNNYEVARPLLASAGIPATFFVTTGAIESGSMWNDLVIEAIRRGLGQIDLSEFGLGCISQGELQPDEFLMEVLSRLKYLEHDKRAAAARQIYSTACGDDYPRLMMTPDMVRRLAEQGHDIGAHTVHHPILSKLDPTRAQAEIEQSGKWVEDVTGIRPHSFAYPNGRPGIDFDDEHMRMASSCGFECAVSTSWGCATRRSHPMALERFTPWERSRSGFFKRLVKTSLQSFI